MVNGTGKEAASLQIYIKNLSVFLTILLDFLIFFVCFLWDFINVFVCFLMFSIYKQLLQTSTVTYWRGEK